MTDAPFPQLGTPAGWYADPWGQPGQWRWWDGYRWMPQVAGGQARRKPRLPGWLSPPVVVAAVPMVPLLAVTALLVPVVVPLGLVPALLVTPTLIWLDRVEPEPRAARAHALLWGALVATGGAILVNTIVAATISETVSVVVSAPLFEEALKGAAVLWAVRRQQVDGVMDGVIYAGWAALGFAIVEDILYFSVAVGEGDLIAVFVIRAVLSPFAHPLFTAWIGMAIGWAITTQRSMGPAVLGGYGLAVASHALWNGSLVNADSMGGGLFLLVSVVIFVTLFCAVAVVLYRLRRKEERRFVELVPWLAQRYRMAPQEVDVFGHFGSVRRTRKGLRGTDRRRFDLVHAALARLALLHDRPGGADPEAEGRLVDQLQRARRA